MRKTKKPTALRPQVKPVQRLSELLLAEMAKFRSDLIGKHISEYSTGGAMWRLVQGVVSELPQGKVLRWADDSIFLHDSLRTQERCDELLIQLGDFLRGAIRGNDDRFFRTLAVILKARKNGKKGKEWKAVAKLTRRQLGAATGAAEGRKTTAYDLSSVMPRALIHLMTLRCDQYINPDLRTDATFSRGELRTAIQDEMRDAGMENPPALSETALSRLITKAGIRKFMVHRKLT